MATETPKHYYLSDFPELYKAVKPGDILEYPRGLYSHFAVFVGKYRNIEHCIVHMTTADDSLEAQVFNYFREYVKKLNDEDSEEGENKDLVQELSEIEETIVKHSAADEKPAISENDGDLPPEGSGGVLISSIEAVLSPDGYVFINNTLDQKLASIDPQEVAQRAIERFENRDKEAPYSLPFNNCEHFATSTRYGVHKSQQIQTAVDILAKTLQEVKDEVAKEKAKKLKQVSEV